MYFDGPREYGYGGYKYDGRWKSVARDIVEHFELSKGDRVLDVGGAKGFLVKDSSTSALMLTGWMFPNMPSSVVIVMWSAGCMWRAQSDYRFLTHPSPQCSLSM